MRNDMSIQELALPLTYENTWSYDESTVILNNDPYINRKGYPASPLVPNFVHTVSPVVKPSTPGN